jgi:hypothetical protein
LFEATGISPSEIGRLDVATESSLDLSKSIKLTVADLLGLNPNVIGSDVLSACYGGTQVFLLTFRFSSGAEIIFRQFSMLLIGLKAGIGTVDFRLSYVGTLSWFGILLSVKGIFGHINPFFSSTLMALHDQLGVLVQLLY